VAYHVLKPDKPVDRVGRQRIDPPMPLGRTVPGPALDKATGERLNWAVGRTLALVAL
jgi:hypothetical protein